MLNLREVKYIIPIITLILIMAYGCKSDTSRDKLDFLLTQLEDGDLIFRRGTGFVGHVVVAADNNGQYSHVGIVVCKDNKHYVVHAVPHEHEFDGDYDRVKHEDVRKFIGRYESANLGLYRPMISDSLKAKVVDNAWRLSNAGIKFDHDYNLNDTTKLYCTELVEYVYGTVGISLSEGRRTDVYLPGMSGEYIMPSDITQSSILKPIINL